MIRKTLFTTLLLMVSLFAFAQSNESQELYNAKVCETLALDYSMPDYSVRKIDAKVMGPRLAAILTKLNEMYKQETYLHKLSFIQSEQIEGLNYTLIKAMKLDRVFKEGNEITVRYITTLGSNDMYLNRGVLKFVIRDGVSDDRSVNDLLCNICRYDEEVKSIETAVNHKSVSVKEHFARALELYSQRPEGDYANSIKESISAVEYICREFTGANKLGEALNAFEKKGLPIHPRLKEAFEQLYAYTNQPNTRVRHALMDNSGSYSPGHEEALFFLVTCSSFVNYLTAKFPE